jgi:oligopeptidase B
MPNAGATQPENPPTPPVAKRVPSTAPSLGEPRVDQYAWLREKDSPAVLDYLAAENAYTDAVLAPTQTLQATLVQEFIRHTKLEDRSVPYARDGWLYYEETDEKSDYPRYLRKRSDTDPPQLLLDLNELAKSSEYVDVGTDEPSDDGRMIAYTIDLTGFRDYKLSIKDIDSGRLLPDTADDVSSLVWANDNLTLIYATENEAKRADKVWRHKLGGKPELIYEETDETFNVAVGKTLDKTFIVITSFSYGTASEQVIPATEPETAPRPLAPRMRDVELYVASHRENQFFLRVNDKGRNFRLVTVQDNAIDLSQAIELIPDRLDVFLEDVNCFRNHVVVTERAGGLPRMSLFDPQTRESKPIEMPEPVYATNYGANYVFDSDQLRFGYQSLVTPPTIYSCDMNTRQLTVLKREEIPGGYDPSAYEQQMVYAPARDGTKIPVSLVRRKDTSAEPGPLLLDVYGAYGLPEWVWFESPRISLLDRGVTFAIAHVRGGGELGKTWHDAGRLLNKKTTFSDTIDVTLFLQQHHYTTPSQMAISGASAGGMTVGAVLNDRPELYKAALVGVPFLDVMNTMFDDSLPLTTGEYLEWGNPSEKQFYDYMISYSPYDNLKSQKYPAMLVYSSYNDSQVMYWEPAKYVAKLRTLKQGDEPLLLRLSMTGGHGGVSGRSGVFEQVAEQYAFVLWQLGIDK